MQHAVPAQVVKLDSHPSSAAGAAGWLQLPQPGWQVELQAPPLHESPRTLAPEQLRPHDPQSAVFVPTFVSHPCEGSPLQWAKPPLQLSVQLALQVPLTSLQQVDALQTTDPRF